MNKIKVAPYTPHEFVVEQISSNEANIIAYPFETGYAVSLAHPLRRFLLSSSVGCAPIAVKIEGAKHEFDSIRGMLEDISAFIINLKNIRFELKESIEEAEVTYNFTGPCEIKGSDLVTEDVDAVTPDAFLATLNEDATLNFSLKICQGVGYVSSEDIRDELDEGYIALDAYFTPVKRASYTIENVLVEDNPNFEKIVLNILTDGQTSPVDAFSNALRVMRSQMSVFDSEISVQSPILIDKADESEELKTLLSPIESMGVSARSFNCLERAGIKLVGEIVSMGHNDLKNVKNLGKKSYEEIVDKLAESGFSVGQEIPDEFVKALKKKLEEK